MAFDVRVVLDVFSGRPNPDWLLSPAEADVLLAKARNLSVESRPQPTNVLGYRGFEVYRADRFGFVAWLRVANGLVTVLDRGGVQTYQDSAGIESWLQDLARGRGMNELIPGDRA